MKQSIRTKPTFQQEKPTFRQIRQRAKKKKGGQRITQQDITTLAGISIEEVYIVDIGGYSSQEKIHKVLHAFNQLAEQRLNKHDIRRGGVIDTEGERG